MEWRPKVEVFGIHIGATGDEQLGNGLVGLGDCQVQRQASGEVFLVDIRTLRDQALYLIDIAIDYRIM